MKAPNLKFLAECSKIIHQLKDKEEEAIKAVEILDEYYDLVRELVKLSEDYQKENPND